jgi:hypothetical protein
VIANLRGIFCFAALALMGSAAQAQDLAPGPEQTLVSQACTTCHLATQFTSQRKTAGQWAETVNQMINMGAVVGDSEFDRIVNYLAKNYGPAK